MTSGAVQAHSNNMTCRLSLACFGAQPGAKSATKRQGIAATHERHPGFWLLCPLACACAHDPIFSTSSHCIRVLGLVVHDHFAADKVERV